MSEPDVPYPVTPDGRYFVVRGRLWRMSNPRLDSEVRQALVTQLMTARREVSACGRRGDLEGQKLARRRVDDAKRGLGERGPVWWQDEAPDENRRMVRNTGYAAWFECLKADASSRAGAAPPN
jgi:hypothetical protein